MRVEVLLFGPAAAAIGADRVAVECDGEPTTAAAVLEAIPRQHPALAAVVGGGRLAVNHTFADPQATIVGGEEIALIAMVGGG